MLKNVIERELKEQKISRTLLLDGICGEQEFLLWVEKEEPAVWVMQVHAMAQRVGKSVDGQVRCDVECGTISAGVRAECDMAGNPERGT